MSDWKEVARKAWEHPDWKKAAEDVVRDWHPPTKPELPDNWDQMSVGALWDRLNDPDRHEHTANSTYEAVVWSLIWNDGWYDAKVRARIGMLSQQQLRQLVTALRRHRDRVNPFIVAAVKRMLP